MENSPLTQSHSLLNHMSLPELITALMLIAIIQSCMFLLPFPCWLHFLIPSKYTSSSGLLSPSLANPRDSSQGRKPGEGRRAWQEVKNSTTNSPK